MILLENNANPNVTDTEGNTQPPTRTENERGYGNASWKDHGVTVTVS